MGEEISQAEKKKNAEGRAEKIAEGVGLGVGSVGGQNEADHDDFRAKKNAKTQRGTDGQRVEHKQDCGGGVGSRPPAGFVTLRDSGPIAQKDRAAVS